MVNLSELPYARRKKFPLKYVIEVIPSLPFLTCSIEDKSLLNENCIDKVSTTELNKKEVDEEDNQAKKRKENLKPIHNYPLKLYAGESRNLNLVIANSSINDDQIESINIKLISSLTKELESKIINFDVNELHKKLPLNANSSIELNLKLYGAGDFITTNFTSKDKDLIAEQQNKQQTNMPSSSVNTPAHKKTQATLGSTLANFLSDLQSTPRHSSKQQTPSVKKVNSSPTSKFTNKVMKREKDSISI